IHVIASIHTAPGRRADVLKAFHALAPEVHAEAGCIEYGTAVDLENVIDGQPAPPPHMGPGGEKMEGPAPPRAHLAAPHMHRFREKVKDIVTGVEIRVLDPA